MAPASSHTGVRAYGRVSHTARSRSSGTRITLRSDPGQHQRAHHRSLPSPAGRRDRRLRRATVSWHRPTAVLAMCHHPAPNLRPPLAPSVRTAGARFRWRARRVARAPRALSCRAAPLTRVWVGVGSRRGGLRLVGGGGISGRRSCGLSRICQGVWWMMRWWWPQSRARLSRVVAAVDPVGDVVGVAHHRWSGAAGEGAVLVTGDQGVPDAGVTRRRVRPRSRTSLTVPRTAGMSSASQASRRTTGW